MKKAMFLLLALLGSAIWFCNPVTTTDGESRLGGLQDQIQAVENNLTGRVQIEGQETYNIYERMVHFRVPGVSIAVIQDYKLAWAKGYGWADERAMRPVTEKTLFHVASISKTVNATGVLKLADSKQIDLDKDINLYLKSWKFPYDSVSHGKRITIANLLSHTAGLSNSGPMYGPKDPHPTVLQDITGTPPSVSQPVRSIMEPNLRSEYSNPGIGITQVIVEDITGIPYAKYMQDAVFQPLGMTNSYYTEESLKQHRDQLSTGYRNGVPLPGKRAVVPMSAAGGLWTTPTDLAKLICELQLAYAGKSSKILSQAMVKRMFSPVIDPAGLGVFVEERGGIKYFQHSGLVQGFKGQYYGSFEGGHGVVVLINSNSPSTLVEEIVNSVATVYQWKGFYQPIRKQAIPMPDSVMERYSGLYTWEGDRYTNIVKKDDGYYLFADGSYSKIYFSSPTDFFNVEFPTEKHFLVDENGKVTGYERRLNGEFLGTHIKVQDPSTLTVSEMMFSDIGWNFLENKDFSSAVRYFERGMQLYPNSPHLLCNAAHGFLFNGQFDTAIGIYKAHLNDAITEKISFRDMVRDDFVFFNQLGFDRELMDRVIAKLGMVMPPEYQMP